MVAASGDEALRLVLGDAFHEPGEFSVILLDLKLPKVGGIEVLRTIRSDERTRLTPVVVLTSSDEERDLVESYRLGANSYVRKPIDYTEFVEAVRQLGIYWLLLNMAPRPARSS